MIVMPFNNYGVTGVDTRLIDIPVAQLKPGADVMLAYDLSDEAGFTPSKRLLSTFSTGLDKDMLSIGNRGAMSVPFRLYTFAMDSLRDRLSLTENQSTRPPITSDLLQAVSASGTPLLIHHRLRMLQHIERRTNGFR